MDRFELFFLTWRWQFIISPYNYTKNRIKGNFSLLRKECRGSHLDLAGIKLIKSDGSDPAPPGMYQEFDHPCPWPRPDLRTPYEAGVPLFPKKPDRSRRSSEHRPFQPIHSHTFSRCCSNWRFFRDEIDGPHSTQKTQSHFCPYIPYCGNHNGCECVRLK